MLGFAIVWWSYGYSLSDLQRVTPMILAHTAEPTVAGIYRQATTVALAAIVACQIGNLFACRSELVSAFQLNWTNNRLLWVGIGVECAALIAFIYVPFFSDIFATFPLSSWQWLLLLFCPAILLGAEELRKAVFQRQ